MVIYSTAYKCPYCRNTYNTESQARDCGNECRELEVVEEINMFFCEMCNRHYRDEVSAETCEDKHTLLQDKAFRDYQYKKNFEALANAAKHPAQKRYHNGRNI